MELRTRYNRGLMFAMVGGVVMYVVFLQLPISLQTRLNGIVGYYDDGQFVVHRLFDRSPAEQAGLRAGDIILAVNGQSVEAWHALYSKQLPRYLELWSDRSEHFSIEFERDGDLLSTEFQTLSVTGTAWLRYCGVRYFIAGVWLALALFLTLARPRGFISFLVVSCFCMRAVWLFSNPPYWPDFFSPLHHPTTQSGLHPLIMEHFTLQIVIVTLIHILLIFPNEHPLFKRYRWIIPSLYTVGVMIPAVNGIYMGFDLFAAAHHFRQALDSFLLLSILLLVIDNFVYRQTEEQRRQTRCILYAIFTMVLIYLSLWYVPIVIMDRPLVDNYDWLLLPNLLIPITVTYAVSNYKMFGVRGILNSRLKEVQMLLEREKTHVIKRDQLIQELMRERNELKKELASFSAYEGLENDHSKNSTLDTLQARYPLLTKVRAKRLLGVSSKWDSVYQSLVLASHSTAPTLIVGESGTGKSDLALTLYELSQRNKKVYREISCAQFEHADPSFALGRLFGIGANHGLPNIRKEGQKGILEECDLGTLFLDDVDRLPLNVQDLLLYPLEGKAFEPGIGAGLRRQVSIKFILATNRDPAFLVKQGIFRRDVLARIGTRINVPSLRERPEDIPLLVDHFLELLADDYAHKLVAVSPKALALLAGYSYPEGNVRELMAEIRTAIGNAMLEDDNILRAGYLSEKLRNFNQDRYPIPAPNISKAGHQPSPALAQRPSAAVLDVLRKHRFQIAPSEKELGYSAKSRTLSHHLRGICLQALCENDWDVDRAASLLAGEEGATAAKIKRKMRRYLRTIKENVDAGLESKLYSNLPSEYAKSLDAAVSSIRSISARVPEAQI
ncbi:MAG: sigma 54-interacting transcriptional regulator [Gammaproteobacteria bacterium]